MGKPKADARTPGELQPEERGVRPADGAVWLPFGLQPSSLRFPPSQRPL